MGGAVAARGRREAEGLIGMIVNIVALRADLSGDPPFAELLERVRRVTREAFGHQEMPFSQVVDALKPERALGHLPVYQVAFSVHDSPYPEPTLGPARVEVTEGLPNGSTKFDLQVIVMPRAEQRPGALPDEIEMAWEYDTDLFDAATVDRFIERYWSLLGGAVAAPDTASPRCRCSTDAERALLAAWNDTAEAFDAGGGHAARAGGGAGAPHARRSGRRLRGRDADLRGAGRAGGRRSPAALRGMGVGPESRVGVCMERSAELVVALLGVLKAGGRVRAAGPRLPGGAPGVHGGGRGGAGAADAGAASRDAAGARGRGRGGGRDPPPPGPLPRKRGRGRTTKPRMGLPLQAVPCSLSPVPDLSPTSSTPPAPPAGPRAR